MSPRARHISLYALFVGLPVAGLVGVLWAGRGLVAPPSVAGRWAFDPGAGVPAGASCAPAAEREPPSLEVAQSGPHLRMQLRSAEKTPLDGEVQGNQVTGQAPTVRLRAEIDRRGPTQALVGTIEVPRCGAQVPFRATRQTTNGKGVH
jgi:hypothetical protein